jgi:hypothetical protein
MVGSAGVWGSGGGGKRGSQSAGHTAPSTSSNFATVARSRTSADNPRAKTPDPRTDGGSLRSAFRSLFNRSMAVARACGSSAAAAAAERAVRGTGAPAPEEAPADVAGGAAGGATATVGPPLELEAATDPAIAPAEAGPGAGARSAGGTSAAGAAAAEAAASAGTALDCSTHRRHRTQTHTRNTPKEHPHCTLSAVRLPCQADDTTHCCSYHVLGKTYVPSPSGLLRVTCGPHAATMHRPRAAPMLCLDSRSLVLPTRSTPKLGGNGHLTCANGVPAIPRPSQHFSRPPHPMPPPPCLEFVLLHARLAVGQCNFLFIHSFIHLVD